MDLSAVSDLCDDYSDDFVVDPFEVDKRLSSNEVHKSTGPDSILNWLLRNFSSLLCQPLAAIYNSSVRQGVAPRIWKSAGVVPVPKIHPPASIQDDLRPISLLPTLAKVLEGIVRDWLMPSLEPLLDVRADLPHIC